MTIFSSITDSFHILRNKLLVLAGDIEKNPAPPLTHDQIFKE